MVGKRWRIRRKCLSPRILRRAENLLWSRGVLLDALVERGMGTS